MEPIAVVGLSFKLPGGIEDELNFWNSLVERRNVMTPWPESRVNVDTFYEPKLAIKNTMSSKGGYFLSQDPAAFDAQFFSIPAKEAASIDPQQRWLLEASYRALENAGMPVEKVAGTSTGVFASSMTEDYLKIICKDPDQAPATAATGISASILANRISWYFDLRGPSIQINTACSSSLTGMDLACQSLRVGQSSMALVAGCNAILSPEATLFLSNMGFLSPDSRCYSFDHRANGYARGEGIIVLVLKRLSDAIINGDSIRAVIRGTGCNQDGHTPVFTQPSQSSQEQLIRQVYKNCNLGLESTRYVEAHGTGTKTGDPIEANALGRVFKSYRTANEPLYIGSVKANIGHLEAASGLASILKCIMVLERGIILPNALFESINPKINVKSNRIQIPTSCIPWPVTGLRRVSINSFGFGGSNAHIIIDDAFHTLEALGLVGIRQSLTISHDSILQRNEPPVVAVPPDCSSTDKLSASGAEPKDDLASTTHHDWDLVCANSEFERNLLALETSSSEFSTIALSNYKLLVWSANNEAALGRMLQQYVEYWAAHVRGSEVQLDRLAYTLAAGRSMMPWRCFAVVNTEASLEDCNFNKIRVLRSPSDRSLAFVFTGQGAQYAQMGLDLQQYHVFRSILIRADQTLCDLGADWSLFDELVSGTRINKPQLSQPLCTALQIAIVELLKSYNVVPTVVVGHSSGEIAAAYTIGALSFKSALKVAYHRGRLAGQLNASSHDKGAMISVNLSEAGAEAYLDAAFKRSGLSGINIACINSPSNVTLSGDKHAVQILKEYLDKDTIFGHILNTGVAYHSPTMEDISQEYIFSIGRLEPRELNSTAFMVSSVTGLRVSSRTLLSPRYWADNLVSVVRFADALQYLILSAPETDGIGTISDFIEVGPHGALKRSVNDTICQVSGGRTVGYSAVLSRSESPSKTVLELVGKLFAKGHDVAILEANKQHHDMMKRSFLLNTPEYPFDHSQLHWHETRLSRDWRLREATPRSIIGVRATDWNSLAPMWRKTLSIEEMPWMADHVIGNDIFFPATGMIMMALEAVKQSAGRGNQAPCVGYLLKEATFLHPIVIKPEGNTELMTHLHPIHQAYGKTASLFRIQIFVNMDTSWRECFKATIYARYEELSAEVDGGYEARIAMENFARNYAQAKETCEKRMHKHDFYKGLSQIGFQYGDTFTLVEDLQWDGHETAIARIMPPGEPFEGIVHPAVFDALLHVCFAAPSEGGSKTLATIIPHIMREVWISNKGWQSPHTSEIRVLTKSHLQPFRGGAECYLLALADDGTPLCHMKQFVLSPIMNQKLEDNVRKTVVHQIEWKPQLSLLTPQQLSYYCKANEALMVKDEEKTTSYCEQLETTLKAVVQHSINKLVAKDWSKYLPHLRRYLSWMEIESRHYLREDENQLSEDAMLRSLKDLSIEKRSWNMFVELAQHILSISRGEMALDHLQSYTLPVQEFYDGSLDRLHDHGIESFLDLSAHQNPAQRILQIGAGTGVMASFILTKLQRLESHTGGTAFSEYFYADISSTHFDEVSKRFVDFSGRITVKCLDIDQDLTTQGLEAGTYDMIIAGNTLHDIKALPTILQNLRRVIKSGGHLVIHEPMAPGSFALSFGFGLMLGQWSGDEENDISRLFATETQWDLMLSENGFSGNDLVLQDSRTQVAHHSSTIFSTAKSAPQTLAESSKIILVVKDNEHYQESVATLLAANLLGLTSSHPQIFSMNQLAEAKIGPLDYVIFLADLGLSLLAHMSKTNFDLVKSWIQQSPDLLWVTCPAMYNKDEDTKEASYVYAGLKDGLLRTIRSEYSNKTIISLSLDDMALTAVACAEYISQVFKSVLSQLSSDIEYIVRDGKITTGRLIEATCLSKETQASIHPEIRIEPWLSGPPLVLDIGTRGELDTLHFKEDVDQKKPLGGREIEIESRAWALAFRDMFSALGRLDEGELGSDCAGVVTRIGSLVQSVQPGDRVCMSAFGCIRTYPRGDEGVVVKIPDSLAFEEACATIGPTITSWYALMEVARLKKGEKVLIHAASGATGQLAIQIAQSIGAEVFATVGYDYKKQLLMDLYNIPSNHIFFSRNITFAQGIMRVTDGYGVDVILNSLTDESLQASWECIAPYGRFIEIGKADIQSNNSLPMAHFARNVSFCAVDIRHLMLSRRNAGKKLLQKAMRMAEDGITKSPRPLHLYNAGAIEDAFRFFQSGKNTGRIVVQVNPSTMVQKLLTTPKTWTFDKDASYLIAGGLGGIGRSMLRWMARKGARHLIVLTRSGVSTDAAAEVVKDLSREGVTIWTPKCDVSSMNSLSETMKECAKTMPPIKGCINAAMVLNDSIFDNMSHTEWEQSLHSKVSSSWNLHILLPNLDFFVMLSSVSGIVGNPGQGNYAAGCTFQDRLARYRVSQGQRALSIDLGPMRTIGVISESGALQKTFASPRKGLVLLEEDQFLSFMDTCCDPSYQIKSAKDSQLAIGLETPAGRVAKSLEPLKLLRRPLYLYFSGRIDESHTGNSVGTVNFAKLFRQLESAEEKAQVVTEALAQKLARALSMKTEDMDLSQPLHAFGVDSLVAVELRSWIAKEFAADIPVSELTGFNTVAAIGVLVTDISYMTVEK